VSNHTYENKLKAVKMVQEAGKTHGYTAKELGVGKVTIQRWLAFYEAYGMDGLKIQPYKYSGDFKVRVVKYVLRNNISYFRAAILFKVANDSIIGRWVKKSIEEGMSALYKNDENGVRQMKSNDKNFLKMDYSKLSKKELLEEIERLDCENAYLKKLDALLQEKEKSAGKKK